MPVWLEINEWTLNANVNPATDPGELTHQFTNAWVYINGKVIGVFEVPCKIPVLVSGDCEITIYPTILNNGISATKKVYPFTESYITNLNLVEGETYTINPTTQYFQNTHFWIEDFENSNLKFVEDNSVSKTSLQVGNNPAISQWGNYGHIHLTLTDSIWVSVSEAMPLPKGGAEVYLEINYRNNNSFTNGIQAISSSGTNDNPLYRMNRQEGNPIWKKMYLDLKETVSYYGTALNYKQYFKAVLNDDLSEADIYIDNIKVVYFQ